MTAVLQDDVLAGLVDLGDLIDAVRTVHRDLTLGQAEQPVPAISATAGTTIVLPMVATSHRFGLTVVKVLTDAPGNREGGGPTQQSTVVVLDSRTGARLAVMSGGACTRMRTAAASAVATDALARNDSRVLGLVGAGPLAVEHVAAVRTVRPIDTVVVWSRSASRVAEFRIALRQREHADGVPALDVLTAPGPRHVVEAADVLCTLTPSRVPVVEGAWLRPGQHINAVGAPPRPDHREIDSHGMARATVVVDNTDIQLQKSGEVLLSLKDGTTTEDDFRCELGAVLAGLAPGRTQHEQITLFNSVGIALQDLAFAALALKRTPWTTPNT
ncbi:ornithine cyclodeaminase family protein [Amycolatopsis alkalitolerans]|uniref:Ornithine cyclodeaminase family protein n=1 Tax=Amycolatopsis alkalitolerans TaxID=2547244 RepID=A0A5C4LQD6_9PSEU|nr:ornithine cyclodeaminase family protein [Amycolatopsis alkalitolerans]TNC20575.1 ornithine cyclodeaminase family protein [Amycolatopsis alkalitolerans]